MTIKKQYLVRETQGYLSLLLLFICGFTPLITLVTGNAIFLLWSFAAIYGFISVQHGVSFATNGFCLSMVCAGIIECIIELACHGQSLSKLAGPTFIAYQVFFLALGVLYSILLIKRKANLTN